MHLVTLEFGGNEMEVRVAGERGVKFLADNFLRPGVNYQGSEEPSKMIHCPSLSLLNE